MSTFYEEDVLDSVFLEDEDMDGDYDGEDDEFDGGDDEEDMDFSEDEE